MQGLTKLCIVLILIAAIPFAIFVWPTKYAYDRLKLGEADFPVRIHRLTGDAEQLTPVGWRPLKQGQTDSFGRPAPAPSPSSSGRSTATTPTPTLRRPTPTPGQSER